MFDSRVLETAIGLVFLFLGFALIATAIQESIASALALRASTLKSGLKSMLAEGPAGFDFYNKLISHPVITPAGDNPSYLSATQFSTAAIHLLSGSGSIPATVASLRLALQNMPDAPYKTAMLSMFRDGEADLEGFEGRLRNWFDQSMDRVSGVYKRISQYISLGISVVLAFLFQVNAIAIANTLWNEPPLRSAVADAATNVSKNAGPTPDNTVSVLSQFHFTPIWSGVHFSWSWLVGCAVTAFAMSLGAPFWFDLLQKFVSLRSTGPVPAKAASTSH